MRLAVLANAFPPDARGGAGVIAEAQVRLLREHGHEVRVFLGDLSWTQRNVLARLAKHVSDLQPNTALVHDIVAWKPDQLLTHNLTGCGWGTPHVIQARGIPWVHVLHDVQGFEPSGRLVDAQSITTWQRVWTKARGYTMGCPNVILSPTQWLVDVYARRGWFVGARVQVLPNPAPRMGKHEREHEPVPASLRLLYVGRLSQDKGFPIAQQVARTLGDTCVLTVIGDVGTDTANVRYMGASTTDRVLEEMSRQDALLVPSCIVENQPTVLLEAMSRGLPSVARAIGGIPETLGGAGILCASTDVHEWVQAVHAVTKDWNTYSVASRTAWQRHDPTHYGDELVACLSNADRSNL